ncbi:TetR/AcrR family transcriptional regulator C-terminal domain-containing protein [Actinophytocola sp.]|uniref:TetR/AcrR family transcriptional regulator C-terminal domain-containing protein n=1 Tax=Actinophytocola sp. TaxID=1872138 RepID=UPI002D7F10B5|nr:TetR/AcrR family transcriptional regulator C-terminal domain-containing protein [Actinophytocola sp.]HET9143458.1 TetR/AcrR family transcriptional regulator C-terminal domain-containing protein [Actinophytocola sp.]
MPAKKDEAASGLARSIEVLWGEPERPSRGPKPGLSVAGIVAAAIAVADSEGLGAVSMQRVAAGFGFTTMSLYRYVPGKSELLDLMIDAAVGEPPDLRSIPGGWRPRLAVWARLTRDCFVAHPWFMPAALNRMMGPNQLGWLESAVAALAETRLAGQELLASVLVVNGWVRSMAPFAPDRTGADPTGDWGAAMLHQINAHSDRFPTLATAIGAGALTPAGFDDFEFGLQRVLDGLQAYIDSRDSVS